MDLSHWNKTFPNLVAKTVTKQFYGKYLYKIKIHAKACGILHTIRPNVTVADHYRDKVDFYSDRKFYQPGWWGNSGHGTRWLDGANVPLIDQLYSIRKTETRVFTRCEDPHFSIYSNSESDLFDVAKKINWPDAVIEFWSPDPATVSELVVGSILRRRATPYQYLIKIRDGKYDTQVKTNIATLLENQTDQVMLSKGVKKQLTSSSNYLYNAYFYAKDQSIATFMILIDPQSVSSVHKIVVNK